MHYISACALRIEAVQVHNEQNSMPQQNTMHGMVAQSWPGQSSRGQNRKTLLTGPQHCRSSDMTSCTGLTLPHVLNHGLVVGHHLQLGHQLLLLLRRCSSSSHCRFHAAKSATFETKWTHSLGMPHIMCSQQTMTADARPLLFGSPCKLIPGWFETEDDVEHAIKVSRDQV